MERVQSGQKITAQQHNELIDAINGSSSQGGFQSTGSGTVYYDKAHFNVMYQSGAWRTMFQVQPAECWLQTSRGEWDFDHKQHSLLIDLGPDVETLKQSILVKGEAVKDVGIVVGESPSMDCKVDDDTYKNSADQKSSWVDLGIKAEDTDFIAGDLIQCKPADAEEGDDSKKWYFVITDQDKETAKERAKDILGMGDDPQTVERVWLMKKGSSPTAGSTQVPIQVHTGMISFTGTKSDAISVDTDWTKANLSSIDTISVDTSLSGDGSETGDVYTLYNFGTASHLQLSEVLAKDQESHKMADIVLRIGRDNKDLSSVPTTIEYMPVSALVICCDTEVDDAESRSLERSSVNEQPFLRIKGFKDESSIKEPPVKYSFLVRDENDAVKELKYVDSEAISAGGSSISGDANLTAVATDSIERVYDGDLSSSYLRLYQFDDPDIEEVRNVLPENEDYTLEDPDGYEMVALYRRDGVLSYAKIQLNPLGVYGDKDKETHGAIAQRDKKVGGDDNYKTLGLVGWHTANDNELTTQLQFGQTTSLNLGGAALVRSAKDGDLSYKKVNITLPEAASHEDITNIENNITIISGDLSSLSAELSGLDDKYWHQGGDNTNCYGTTIGDSQKSTVIDLDSRQLKLSWGVDQWMNVGQGITIGSTGLNEQQLQRLLALIS